MKHYAICRNSRFLRYTKANNINECWSIFITTHCDLGGRISDTNKFLNEAKQLGFEVREYDEEL